MADDPRYKRLIALSKLDDLSSEAGLDALIRDSLGSCHKRSMCLAAQLAGKLNALEFASELLGAYARSLDEPLKSDPGCDIKTAIVATLESAAFDDEDFFLRAIQYRQFEPIFGGSLDTAAPLRVHAGFALTELNRINAIGPLVELLVDPENTARAGAARALATCAESSGKHLLRLKVDFGDPDPAVLGECCFAYLSMAGSAGVPIVARHLRSESRDVRMETAFALGNSRLLAALKPLQDHSRRVDEWEEAQITLTAMALLQMDEATEFLFAMLEVPDNSNPFGPEAIKALSHVRDRDAIQVRVAKCLQHHTNQDLDRAFRESFVE